MTWWWGYTETVSPRPPRLHRISIHTAFIKYPEGDGDSSLDYYWISPEQSSRITKAIISDLAANGFEIVKKGT